MAQAHTARAVGGAGVYDQAVAVYGVIVRGREYALPRALPRLVRAAKLGGEQDRVENEYTPHEPYKKLVLSGKGYK